jgi:hypothetical protein
VPNLPSFSQAWLLSRPRIAHLGKKKHDKKKHDKKKQKHNSE